MELNDWRVFGGTIELENPEQKVKHIDVQLLLRDTASRDPNDRTKEMPFFFTDLQVQPGHQKTGWNPATGVRMSDGRYVGEMLDRIEFEVDENKHYEGYEHRIPPKIYTPEELNYERLFNIMGRGHETLTFPNDVPEPMFWDQVTYPELEKPVEVLTTGMDWTIVPKDDFDVLRLSTFSGGLLPEENFLYKDVIEEFEEENPNTVRTLFREHPLNTRYSREFYWLNGKAGDEIQINASTMSTTYNGKKQNKQHIDRFTVGGRTYEFNYNKFLTIPRGSVRYRIEFYKLADVTLYKTNDEGDQVAHNVRYLKDTGIGYTGHVTFKQWTYGKERL